MNRNYIIHAFVFILLSVSGCTTHDIRQPGELVSDDTEVIGARSIIGYWESDSDGLVIHITEIGPSSTATAGFRDNDGEVRPSGKLRNIEYLGGNKWRCEEYQHSSDLKYPEDDRQMVWDETTIIMHDHDTIRIGDTIYTRI